MAAAVADYIRTTMDAMNAMIWEIAMFRTAEPTLEARGMVARFPSDAFQVAAFYVEVAAEGAAEACLAGGTAPSHP